MLLSVARPFTIALSPNTKVWITSFCATETPVVSAEDKKDELPLPRQASYPSAVALRACPPAAAQSDVLSTVISAPRLQQPHFTPDLWSRIWLWGTPLLIAKGPLFRLSADLAGAYAGNGHRRSSVPPSSSSSLRRRLGSSSMTNKVGIGNLYSLSAVDVARDGDAPSIGFMKRRQEYARLSLQKARKDYFFEKEDICDPLIFHQMKS